MMARSFGWTFSRPRKLSKLDPRDKARQQRRAAKRRANRYWRSHDRGRNLPA